MALSVLFVGVPAKYRLPLSAKRLLPGTRLRYLTAESRPWPRFRQT